VDRNSDDAFAYWAKMAVALLAEGVDRNSRRFIRDNYAGQVALLAEGVDRNFEALQPLANWAVALLAEGVDRNPCAPPRAKRGEGVALLAEGVDRNNVKRNCLSIGAWSPSSRRAWIEIGTGWLRCPGCQGRPPRGGRG